VKTHAAAINNHRHRMENQIAQIDAPAMLDKDRPMSIQSASAMLISRLTTCTVDQMEAKTIGQRGAELEQSRHQLPQMQQQRDL
jgi:hypothetical protein